MRAYNEQLVLTLLRQMEPLAKADIARLTGLSAQTVSVIMRALEAEGLLVKGKPQRGKVGQPSVPMALAEDGAYFLGLKIGRRSLELILTDFLGKVCGRAHKIHAYPDPDEVVQFANERISDLLADLSTSKRKRVAGLGIAMPFQLWSWAKSLEVDPKAMEGWRTRDVAAELARSWDFPIYLQNDATAACGAELVFGDKGKPKDFAYFFVGFFIGGGLVIDNTVYSGRTGNAAALGSMPICSGNGTIRQLVDVASIAILERAINDEGGDGSIVFGSTADWDISDKVLETWLEQASEGIAYAIKASACLVDFQCAIVDGWLPQQVRRQLVDRIASKLTAEPIPGIEMPSVQEGSVGNDARALGAASLPLSDRFLVTPQTFQIT